MLSKLKLDIVEKSMIGAGIATLLFMTFRSRQAFGAYKISTPKKSISPEDLKFYSSYTPRFANTPTLLEVSPESFANPSSRIPAMFMSYDSAKNDMDIKALNFTPRKMSALPDEREYSDISILTNPNTIPDEFTGFDANLMIHPNDYRLLQMYGIIPSNFPISRTQYTKSLNGENEFIVGYSEPTNDQVASGKKFKSVKPLWAVSIGKNFNSSSNPSDGINNLAEFYETAMRMLAAEWELSNVGVNGCLPNIGRRLCDLERAALVGIMMRRREIRDEKRKESGTYEDIAYANRGQTWNRGATYLVGFNGYPGESEVKAYRDKANRQKFENKNIKKRFEDYVSKYMWHMPLLGGTGITHFGHPGTLKHVPDFLKIFNPHASDPKGYVNRRAVRIGGTAVSAHGKYFR